VLGGIPAPDSTDPFAYFIVPSKDMAENVSKRRADWLMNTSSNGTPHKDSGVRIVSVGSRDRSGVWNVREYLNRWDLIEAKLR
jgi:hypothetical protein